MAIRKAVANTEGLKKKKTLKSKFEFDPLNDPFILRNGNERMEAAKKIEIPNKLMGELLYEQTVVMLFAETGVGKTLLAFQLANAISRGESLLGLENEADPQTVLYVDMENGEKVFQSRYSEEKIVNGKKYWFNEFVWDKRSNFLDLTDPADYKVPDKNAVEWWFNLIKYKAEECGAKVIFIDNLFSIINEGGVESTKEVAPILRELLGLKKSKGWTVIVIHHTPKKLNHALTRNDLSGSSNLSNLVDGVIGINFSCYDNDEHSRYIKQIKPTRFSPVKYGDGNLITCRTTLLHPNFIGFEKIELEEEDEEWKYESTHLGKKQLPKTAIFSEEDIENRRQLYEDFVKANPKAGKQEIADYLGVSRQTVYRDINALDKKDNGQLFNNEGK